MYAVMREDDGRTLSQEAQFERRKRAVRLHRKGHSIAQIMDTMGMAYNTQNVTEEEAPKHWKDLLNETFRDQIIMTDPTESGTTAYLVGALVNNEAYGWAFFEDLAAAGMTPRLTRVNVRPSSPARAGVVLAEVRAHASRSLGEVTVNALQAG